MASNRGAVSWKEIFSGGVRLSVGWERPEKRQPTSLTHTYAYVFAWDERIKDSEQLIVSILDICHLIIFPLLTPVPMIGNTMINEINCPREVAGRQRSGRARKVNR
jgi:hypothetical protein